MKHKPTLKLFVWHDVLTDYTSGVMFALAHDVESARKAVLAEHGWSPTVQNDLQQEPEVYTKPCGFAVWGGG